jgi:O-antigen/teichoic acid export membrane protein
VLFNIPLIYFFGIIGAAWGTFFSGMFVASISFYFGQKYAFIAYNKFSYQSYLLFQLFMFFVLILWYLNASYGLSLLIRITLVFIFIVMGFAQKLIRNQFSEILSKMRIQ